MAADGALVAVDWGTTNRRAYLIRGGGEVVDSFADDRGILSLGPADYAGELVAIRSRFGASEVIAAGMVGSNRGWREVPYVAAPCGAASLARGCAEVEPGVWIVPGVALFDGPRADVMRGEETQVVGAIEAGLASADALFCQPGTHNKFIETRDGAIVDFSTAMTGELFSLLRGGGVLRGMLDGPVSDGEAYRAGMARGAEGAALGVALFEIRASVLLGRLAVEDAASFASGVLIGSDVGARFGIAGAQVVLLADGPLADLYEIAIADRGGRVLRVDARKAFVAGAEAIWRLLR